MADIIQFRRDTAAAWTSADPTLAAGELGLETDTGKRKFGDGVTAWVSLGYEAGDADAIHDNVDGEINALTLKASPVVGDMLLIEDSAGTFDKRKCTVESLPISAADADAIHDNQAGEIQPLTPKASPVAGDVLLLEDSAASYAKKSLLISALPAGTPGADSITNTELANMAQDTLKGRTTGAGTGDPVDLTKAQALAILNVTDGADPTSANETSHGDVVQDGDFGSNGYLKRTGAGAYGVQATPIPTADTAAKCTDAAADETSANETSHGNLIHDDVDGERDVAREPNS